jgi:hypothetical protein
MADAAFPGMGKVTDEINGADAVWRFFGRHTPPEPSTERTHHELRP